MIDPLTRLGRPESRGVILTASDAGLCYSVNVGIHRALTAGHVSGASLIVVGPRAREAVLRMGADLGIQLMISLEHALIDLRPLTQAPSLLGGSGGFPEDAADAAEHADPEEAHREFRTQIERAIAFGVRPSFLASHDDVVARHLSLFDVFLDLAEEYHLPIRHGYDFGPISLDAAQLARERGHFVAARTINWSPASPIGLDEVLETLPEGVSEVIVSPAVEGAEMSSVLGDAENRVATLATLERLRPRDLAARLGIAWLSWGDIRTS